jgi:hypothetical protein
MEDERKIELRCLLDPEKPILKFHLGKKVINLEELFSEEDDVRRNALDLRGAGELTAGEDAAFDLMRGLRQTNLQISEYRRAMPRLFEYAQTVGRPEENFNAAFIGNTINMEDEASHTGGGVDVFLEGDKVDPQFLEECQGINKHLQGSRKPVKLPDQDNIG